MNDKIFQYGNLLLLVAIFILLLWKFTAKADDPTQDITWANAYLNKRTVIDSTSSDLPLA